VIDEREQWRAQTKIERGLGKHFGGNSLDVANYVDPTFTQPRTSTIYLHQSILEEMTGGEYVRIVLYMNYMIWRSGRCRFLIHPCRCPPFG
jgi:hypothetical protein